MQLELILPAGAGEALAMVLESPSPVREGLVKLFYNSWKGWISEDTLRPANYRSRGALEEIDHRHAKRRME